ncbi:MAG: ABC transporter substrate-binding protein [Myxococcota bacterium]
MVRRTIASITLGLPLGAACSLALNLDDTAPCSADSECVYTDGQGTCVDGFCVPPGGSANDTADTDIDPTAGEETTPTPVTTTDPGDSSTTIEPEDTTTTTEGAECEVNSDCNEDQRCGDGGTCLNILSAECDILLWPDDGRDNVEFLGSIMPTSPPFDELVQPLENAFELAVDDFNNVASLQDGQKIAWVGCDSTGGDTVASAAATHLVDTVGVNAIVGPVFSESVREVAENITVPADVFVISPTASAASLSNFEDNNLVWRITPNDVFQGNALIDRLTADYDPAPARLLVLNKDDAYGNELQQQIAADLVTDLAPAEVYFANYPGPETFGSKEELLSSYGTVLGQALAQAGIATSAMDYDSADDHYTHVLIIGTSEAEALILSYMSAWGQLYNFAPLPLFTVTHGAVPTMEDIVNSAAAIPELAMVWPLLQAQMRGTSPNIFDAENFTAFNIRYQINFNDEEALTSSSLAYDAALAAMFAMVTIPAGEEITGTGIANGMAALNDPKGAEISFGDAPNVFIQDARNILAAGNTVDLQGVSGALNWDPTNGELRADVLGWNVGNGLIGDPVTLTPYCLYSLFPEPAEDGIWVSAVTGMPPCN